MFNKFFEDWKEKYGDTTKALLYELEEKYKEFWAELMQDLQKKKLLLEEEIVILERKFTDNSKEAKELTTEVLTLREGVKKERTSLESLTGKQEEIAEKCMDYEKRVEKIAKREEDVSKREEEASEKDLELKAKIIDLQERERSVKRIYAKLNR